MNHDTILPINRIEALVLISLNSDSIDEISMVDSRMIGALRSIINNSYKEDDNRDYYVKFDLDELKDIESCLPLFGSLSEETYSPIRVKITNAIYELENIDETIKDFVSRKYNIILEEGNNNASSKSTDDTEDRTESSTRHYQEVESRQVVS